MKRDCSRACDGGARDHADGAFCSANVARSAYGRSACFISLRRARHRRDPSGRSLIEEIASPPNLQALNTLS
jgi:hypothetical protein